MSLRKTVIALIVFVFVLGIYLFDRHVTEIKRLKKEKEESLISFKREDIDALKLVNKNGEFRLAKKNNTWLIKQPVSARADQDVLYTLLANLTGAKKRNAFNADDLSQYGLLKPRAEITLHAGGKSETLLVGEASAYSGQVFAVMQGEKKVFTVSDYVANNVDKTLTDLRDKTIARAAPDQMASFTLTNNTGTLECVKKGDEWEIKKPHVYRTDRLAVENFLREIDGARAVDFVDTATVSTPFAPFGLDKPQITVVLVRATPDEVTKTTETTLLVGARHGAAEYFARRAGDSLIFSIPSDLYAELSKNVGDLRDRSFFRMNMLDIARLEIHTGESAVALIKNEQGEWHIENEPKTLLDQTEVNLALSNVIARKASEWITDNPRSLASYGLEPPKIKFIVQSKDKSGSEGVMIGKKPEDKDIVYVQRIGENTVWGMDWTQTRDFFKTKQDFLDKTLLPIKPDEIARLEVTDRGNKFSLIRKGEQWSAQKTAEGKPHPIENAPVSSLIAALTSIKYDRELELSTNEREQVELDNAAYQFVLFKEKGTSLGELRCTRPIRRFVYAETGARKIYRIKEENFSGVEANLKTLRDQIEEENKF
jgi:hypothetical protein